jgi:hypothetical protein
VCRELPALSAVLRAKPLRKREEVEVTEGYASSVGFEFYLDMVPE